jgi:hypothetical protein
MSRMLTEPGLFDRLTSHLWEVRDTRDAIQDVEAFYRRVIRSTPIPPPRRWRQHSSSTNSHR